MKTFFQENYKTIIVLLIIGFIFIYYLYTNSNDYVSMTPQEELNYNLEILKDENNALKENLENANSQLEDLKKENENDKSLILLLQNQLLSYGIEPFEL